MDLDKLCKELIDIDKEREKQLKICQDAIKVLQQHREANSIKSTVTISGLNTTFQLLNRKVNITQGLEKLEKAFKSKSIIFVELLLENGAKNLLYEYDSNYGSNQYIFEVITEENEAKLFIVKKEI